MAPASIPVTLVPYDPEWPNLAKMYSVQLSVLGSVLVTVHYIGSTAVPGLVAKPIIDLMPLVTNLLDLDREQPSIETLGYCWHGELGIPGRRYCTLSDDRGNRIVQLHFFTEDSPHVTRHLAFREYLRAHPDERKAYQEEKQRARNLYPNDSHAYTDEKAQWIRAAEAKAMMWFDSQQLGGRPQRK